MKSPSKRAGAIAARKRAQSPRPTPPPKAQLFSRSNLLLWGIAAFAFLIRIPNLRWGLPDVEEEALPVHKAFDMWGWDQGHMTLDPQTAGWPALSFYVHFILQKVQYLAGRITGRYHDSLDFFVQHADLSTLMTPARFLSLLMGVAIVVIGVRIAQRLAGWFGARVTGLVLAVSPLLIEQSIKVTPDIFLALFSALALSRLLDVYERGRLSDYLWSAVWIGLGAASKYTPLLLIPCLVVAHLMRQKPARRWKSFTDRRLLLAGATLVAAFFIASPYTFLNFTAAKRDVPSQFSHVVTSGHFGNELKLPGHLFYLVKVLPDALGWPALILGLAGLGLAAWRRRGPWLIVLVYFACFYLGLGALRSLHPHYILPALLPVALGLAALVHEFSLVAPAKWRPWSPALAGVFLAVVMLPLGMQSAHESLRYSRPSTLQEAKQFIMQQLNRPEVTFAVENGGPDLPRGGNADFAHRPVFRRLDAEDRKALLDRPFAHRYEINMYMTDANGSDLYYDLRHYLDYDYIVVSGTAYHRYVGLAPEFPRQNAFYKDLEQCCSLVKYFPESPDRLGPDIWIYSIGPKTMKILADRGSLAPGFQTAFMDKIRRSDLYSFLGFTGDLATRREDWPTADLYLSTLMELRPEIRQDLLLTLGYTKYKAGKYLEAGKLCSEYLKSHPGDQKGLALAASIMEDAAEQRKHTAAGSPPPESSPPRDQPRK